MRLAPYSVMRDVRGRGAPGLHASGQPEGTRLGHGQARGSTWSGSDLVRARAALVDVVCPTATARERAVATRRPSKQPRHGSYHYSVERLRSTLATPGLTPAFVIGRASWRRGRHTRIARTAGDCTSRSERCGDALCSWRGGGGCGSRAKTPASPASRYSARASRDGRERSKRGGVVAADRSLVRRRKGQRLPLS